MAISDTQKVDYLWKKIAYSATKTDVNATKQAANEAIASPFLNRGDQAWIQANQIPTIKPTLSSGVTTLYSDAIGNTVQCTADNTATLYRTWKTNLNNWVPPQFGATYQVLVYIANTGDLSPQTNGTRIFVTGSGANDEWFFDYQSGVLNFIGDNLPAGINFSGKSVFIAGARYTGDIGVENLSVLTGVNKLTFGASELTIDATTITGITPEETVVSYFEKNNFNFAKLIINVKDLTYGQYQSSEVLLVHDGLDMRLTEYALVYTTPNPLATFTATIESSNVVIKASASSSNNTINILRFLN